MGSSLLGPQIRSILTVGFNSHAKPLVPNLMVLLKVSLSLWLVELLLALSASSPWTHSLLPAPRVFPR